MNEGIVLPDKIYTVSQITALVKLELENAFPQLWVEGEISNLTKAHSGHFYFSLKDERAQLGAALFRGEADKVKFELKNGLQILCFGRINVYEPRGQYQLIVSKVEPKGKGALQLAFEQLKDKLRAEGLFDLNRKKKLPLLPKTVGLVTSPRGAAIVDILRTLERRFAPLHIIIYPVAVQGEGAAGEIAAAIDYFGGRKDVDVLIVGRGGGSIEDLWAFNEEIVARAIFRCPIPIISAVGHEVDYTIADFVADVRAATPTAAAELVIDTEESFRERIEQLERRVVQNQRLLIQERRQTVDRLTHHRIFQNFKILLLNLEQHLDDLETRSRGVLRDELHRLAGWKGEARLAEEKMRGSLGRMIQDSLSRWSRLAAQLNALSPLDVLKKGYTLCWKDGGLRLARTIDDVEAGEDLTVSFYQGEFDCRVRSVDRRRTIQSRVIKE
ncbi:MAG: exodeoxyribonuclease VII large subunit [Candidatus Aminicenantes bacterium]|nr:exodeoxyribonuclease VII large subunit [Candidatus Aminicenantes bacterium]